MGGIVQSPRNNNEIPHSASLHYGMTRRWARGKMRRRKMPDVYTVPLCRRRYFTPFCANAGHSSSASLRRNLEQYADFLNIT